MTQIKEFGGQVTTTCRRGCEVHIDLPWGWIHGSRSALLLFHLGDQYFRCCRISSCVLVDTFGAGAIFSLDGTLIIEGKTHFVGNTGRGAGEKREPHYVRVGSKTLKWACDEDPRFRETRDESSGNYSVYTVADYYILFFNHGTP